MARKVLEGRIVSIEKNAEVEPFKSGERARKVRRTAFRVEDDQAFEMAEVRCHLGYPFEILRRHDHR